MPRFRLVPYQATSAMSASEMNEFPRRLGSTEVIPLHLGAAGGSQLQVLVLGLDALGGRGHAEAVAEAAIDCDDRQAIARVESPVTKEWSILILSKGKLRR